MAGRYTIQGSVPKIYIIDNNICTFWGGQATADCLGKCDADYGEEAERGTCKIEPVERY